MIGDSLARFAWLVLIAAIIVTLVRPGSKGSQLVTAITDFFAALVAKSTGQQGSTS